MRAHQIYLTQRNIVKIMATSLPPNIIHPEINFLRTWSSTISSCLKTLRKLAGATEHDFLQIGNQMQDIYQRAIALSETAQQLVEITSGERIHGLIDRLRQILHGMETYLGQAQTQNSNSSATLKMVEDKLVQIVEPLAGVKKVSKYLYVLEVSIKIESVRLGEMGSEFINLAQDIKTLSLQIKEKVDAINDHRLLLSSIIKQGDDHIHAAKSMLETKARLTLNNTATSLSELNVVNEHFSQLGKVVSAVSEENSYNISEIVQSMQFHDIYRQQVEHVIEALEGLLSSLPGDHNVNISLDEVNQPELISKAGDVCELQEAQLQFASSELFTAVASIVSNLRDIGMKQKRMAQDIFAQSGVNTASGASVIDEVSEKMSSVTSLLEICTASNTEISVTVKNVGNTVEQITSFVSAIEEIGHKIILIALNARIEAFRTGSEGASLSVLAEEIGQLSHEAVQSTDLITAALTEIHSATGDLTNGIKNSEMEFSGKLTEMKAELSEILSILKELGAELSSLLSQIQKKGNSFTLEIEKIAESVNVHKRTKVMADEVLRNLKQLFSQARELYPASDAFKDDLRLMAKRYTMESERRIHEDIARKHGVKPVIDRAKVSASTNSSDSEFGDNVDLF